jgi:hypothetical protein
VRKKRGLERGERREFQSKRIQQAGEKNKTNNELTSVRELRLYSVSTSRSQ